MSNNKNQRRAKKSKANASSTILVYIIKSHLLTKLSNYRIKIINKHCGRGP